MRDLSRDKRQKEEELALTKQKYESLEKHVQSAMDGRLRDNLGELANAKAENEMLRQQVADMQRKIFDLQQHVAELGQELFDAKTKALDKNDAVAAREREIEAREREIAAVKRQLREREEQLREQEDKLQSADARNAVLTRQLQQARDELARHDDLQSEIARLRKQNDSARAEHEVHASVWL